MIPNMVDPSRIQDHPKGDCETAHIGTYGCAGQSITPMGAGGVLGS